MEIDTPAVEAAEDRPLRVFDVWGKLPTPQRLAFELASWGADAGYAGAFRARWASLLGVPEAVLAEVGAMPVDQLRTKGVALLEPHCASAGEMLASMAASGVRRIVLHNPLPIPGGMTNDELAELVAAHPDRLVGFARIDPAADGAAEEVRRAVGGLGLRGVTITPFWHHLATDDARCMAVYEAAQDLGVPVWVHTSMNWNRSSPLHLEHPSRLDEVACTFQDLVLLAGHAGWPWVPELVAVAWRHPNVYVDFSAFRPAHLARPGTGWDVLWYHLPRGLRRKVLYGSTWTLLGRPIADLLAEVRSLGLPAEVEDAWLHDNAERILGG